MRWEQTESADRRRCGAREAEERPGEWTHVLLDREAGLSACVNGPPAKYKRNGPICDIVAVDFTRSRGLTPPQTPFRNQNL